CSTNPDWFPNCDENKFLSSPFTFIEYNIALEDKNKLYIPDMVRLDYDVLHKLPIGYKWILLDIFNEMYRTDNYPKNVDGAFDDINIDILIENLASLKCLSNLFKTVFTNITGSSPRTVNKGVPQGGVLSPLLYCIYVATITENLPKSVIISQFIIICTT
ncbi:hypothetical protein TSAR_015454, partial [Trichomalopsis sarcophagae]